MYVSQVMMSYTLNLHSAAYNLHLNKTGKKSFGKITVYIDKHN